MNSYGRHSTNWRDAFTVGWQVKNRSLTQGPRIKEFEDSVAKKVGSKFAVAVSSATAGLHIALEALELDAGSEVATSPISFVSSANAASYAGLKPVFIDIDPQTLNISTDLFKSRIQESPDIRAVIPVHLAGTPCDMESISMISSVSGIRIVEDAAHALGAKYKDGSYVGSCKYSDMTVFSFHPVKSVTTGEGGVITTNNEILYRKLLRLRSHGINQLDDPLEDKLLGSTDGKRNLWYHEMQVLGFHYRLSEIQAALGVSQLRRLERFIENRRTIAKRYDSLLFNVPGLVTTQASTRDLSAHHLYVMRIDFSQLSLSRNDFMSELKIVGIGTQVHYRPIPTQPFYAKMGYDINSIPEAMAYYSECISIPIFPGLRVRHQKKIAARIKSIIESSKSQLRSG